MSWLVRCWEEPREEAHENPVFRCSVRDLRTGEERYLSDPREIGELMLRQVRSEHRSADRSEDKAGDLRRSS
jgi:hypothetical protein